MTNQYTIIGVDEAGRGSLAGPVTAAAVILPKNYKNPFIKDSKKLNQDQRSRLYNEIIKERLENRREWSTYYRWLLTHRKLHQKAKKAYNNERPVQNLIVKLYFLPSSIPPFRSIGTIGPFPPINYCLSLSEICLLCSVE